VVWTYADVQAVYILDPDNRELVTLLECISGSSKVSYDPMIIMSRIVFKEQHFDNNLSDGVLFSISKSGYTNDRLSFEWIKHFNSQTKAMKKGKYRMLIMDGHGSHLTNEFINYCWTEDIVPFLLPAHTTHLLQPLDIGVFQSYKHYHQESLEESVRYGGSDYTKLDFLAGLTKIRKHTFKPSTIRSAFQKAGLIPFCPVVVFDKLIEFSVPDPKRRPETPESDSGWSSNSVDSNGTDWATCVTPARNMRSIQAYSNYIDQRIEGSITEAVQLTPSVARAIEKRNKALNIMVLDGATAKEELFKKQAEETEKVRRKSKGNRTVQKYGTIYVGDARLKAIARNEAEDAAVAEIARKRQRPTLKNA
jgi:DDE superfamily endonuclease